MYRLIHVLTVRMHWKLSLLHILAQASFDFMYQCRFKTTQASSQPCMVLYCYSVYYAGSVLCIREEKRLWQDWVDAQAYLCLSSSYSYKDHSSLSQLIWIRIRKLCSEELVLNIFKSSIQSQSHILYNYQRLCRLRLYMNLEKKNTSCARLREILHLSSDDTDRSNLQNVKCKICIVGNCILSVMHKDNFSDFLFTMRQRNSCEKYAFEYY